MKRIILILLVTLTIGCTKNNQTDDDLDFSGFTLKAEIDGEPFSLEIDDIFIGHYQNAGNAGGCNRISGCISETTQCISLSTLKNTFNTNGFQEGEILDFQLVYTNGNHNFYNYNYNLSNNQTTNLADIPLGQFEIIEKPKPM